MSLTTSRKNELNALCNKFRIDLIELLHSIQTGHPGGSLSVCEILTTLYFEKAKVDPKNPKWPERDRVVLTKGHAAPMLYRVLAEKGFFPVEEMKTLRQLNTRLQGHPCALETPGVELSTGPLGMGLSACLGMAIGLKADHIDSTVYAVMGDGELNEGTCWEACMAASKFKADNLIAIVDRNHVQLDGTSDEIMPLGNLAEKFKAFGFEVFTCNGHDVEALSDTIDLAKAVKGKPAVILAETVKGKGVSFMEGKNTWHGKAINDEECKLALAELRGEK
ncbi:MAG TPA: transketolase [Ruminiclostridium sp.]|mgnify:FL=1|nr:transketolase [Ruminiclostridium sp.]